MAKKEVDEYQKALVAASKGRDVTDIVTGGDSLGLGSFSPQALGELTAKYDIIPTVVTLIEGQGFEGRLVGKGPPVATAAKIDPKDGRMRDSQVIPTWVIELPTGIRFRIMETYEIGAAYPDMVGKNIVTVRLKDVRVGQNMVTKYFIGAARTE